MKIQRLPEGQVSNDSLHTSSIRFFLYLSPYKHFLQMLELPNDHINTLIQIFSTKVPPEVAVGGFLEL